MPSGHSCIVCGVDFLGSHIHRKYCSLRCKAQWRRQHGPPPGVATHVCRSCSKPFQIDPKSQGNKWLCSDGCRRAARAKSVREFHTRRPQMAVVYRARTREKKLPEGNLVRFYRTNPDAPRACEACGESRVLDVAHKIGHERLGAWRSSQNCRWPTMVWVLCPTCHALIDRMRYSPSEIGLE